MLMTNIDHHGILVLRKFDGIGYCDFHSIMISVYSPTLPTSKQPLMCPHSLDLDPHHIDDDFGGTYISHC